MTSPFWQSLNPFLEQIVPGYSLFESAVDNWIRDRVSPTPGAILQCALYGFEHSGIHVGDGKVAHLYGKFRDRGGIINLTDYYGFIEGSNAMTVCVACYGEGREVIGDEIVAQRALEMVDHYTGYNLLNNNCHMFTVGCITGDFNNHAHFFTDLQNTIRNVYGSFNWRAWG